MFGSTYMRQMRIAQRIESTMEMNPGMSWVVARVEVMLTYDSQSRAEVLAESLQASIIGSRAEVLAE